MSEKTLPYCLRFICRHFCRKAFDKRLFAMKPETKLVLLVEEKKSDWKALKSLYDHEDYPIHIIAVHSAVKAADKLRTNHWHAVAADYSLINDISSNLTRTLGNIPLIALIDTGNEHEGIRAVQEGASEFLIKDEQYRFVKLLPLVVHKSVEKEIHRLELQKYRNQLEKIVEERTIELIEMYGKLQENETNFRNIFNGSSDGIIITDYERNFIEANDALLKQFGVTKEFLASTAMMDFLLPAFRPKILGMDEKLLAGQPSGNVEVEIRSPVNGETLYYEISIVPIIFNQKNALLTIMRNIAERKTHARKVFETIIQTEEDERKRFARDLHDEIGPLISALKIYTNSFLETTDAARKDKLARQIGSIMRDVIDSIKIISNDLSPHILENFGLKAAIQSFIDLFSKNIQITFESNLDDLRFPNTTESLIYRIIKELINNTVKHAGASQITINLDYFDSVLVCNYRDNGIGFDWEQQSGIPSKGLGISNIMARIRSLGGELEVQSKPGKGFAINFVFQTILINASQS